MELVDRVGLSIDRVFDEFIYPEYGVDLVEDRDLGIDPTGTKILGRFDFPPENIILLDPSIRIGSGDPRRSFTFGHEIAHAVLHGGWLRHALDDAEQRLCIQTTEASLSGSCERVLERQANLFASHLLAPTWFVRQEIIRVFRPSKPFTFIAPSDYGFEVRGSYVTRRINSFDQLCQEIAKRIRVRFWGLSVEALSYRVKESGHVIDGSHPRMSLHRAARESNVQRRQRAHTPFESLVASLV
jgi:hypothetical protein